MAQLARTVDPVWKKRTGEGCYEWTQRTKQMMVDADRSADKVNVSRTLVDVVIQFPIADGYAVYRVIKDKPLTLEHLPIGDAYEVQYPLIRGLRRTDIKRQVLADRELRKLSSNRA